MKIIPCKQKTAKEFISKYHRHNIPSITSIFNLGLANDDGELIGVVMAGLPKSRFLMDGYTLEITRVCVKECNKNANSMLYGACARIARDMGYRKVITYTLVSESGASLKAAGWVPVHITTGGAGWESFGHGGKPAIDLFGHERIPQGDKIRWEKILVKE